MPAGATSASPFKGYLFPPEIISHAVWLYHRFSLSHRDVEGLLAERGIHVSYEAIRLWCGKGIVNRLGQRRVEPAAREPKHPPTGRYADSTPMSENRRTGAARGERWLAHHR